MEKFYNLSRKKAERSASRFAFFDLREDPRGQTLVEALVAMGIIIVAILGIFALISRSVSLNRVVSDQYVGTYLASEGVELVRNLIDRNREKCDSWNAGFASPEDYFMDYSDTRLTPGAAGPLKLNSDNFYNYTDGVVTPYSRVISIDYVGTGDEMKVKSTVSWKSRGGVNSKVTVEDHFFNWRPNACE